MRLSVSGGTATGESTRNDSLDSLTRMMPGSPGDFKVAAAWTVDDPHVLGKFVKPGGPNKGAGICETYRLTGRDSQNIRLTETLLVIMLSV
jgi:hypothetical protein